MTFKSRVSQLTGEMLAARVDVVGGAPDDAESIRLTSQQALAQLRRAQREELHKRMLADASASMEEYTPRLLSELIRVCPEAILEKLEESFKEGDPGAIQPVEAGRVRINLVPEEAGWLNGTTVTPSSLYWAIIFVLRTTGRDLVRDELEKAFNRLEKYYVLTPRKPDDTEGGP